MKPPHPEVYAGIAYCPAHPVSDMHGLVRVVVMARKRHTALTILRRVGISRVAFFCPSKSIVEHDAAVERKVMVTDLRTGYLRPGDYQEFHGWRKRS